MFTLTAREQCLLAAVLCAAVLGAAVKHWRDARREAVRSAASATIALPSPSPATTPAGRATVAGR